MSASKQKINKLIRENLVGGNYLLDSLNLLYNLERALKVRKFSEAKDIGKAIEILISVRTNWERMLRARIEGNTVASEENDARPENFGNR